MLPHESRSPSGPADPLAGAKVSAHLVLQVGETALALPTECVDSAAPFTSPAAIPRAPSHVLGFTTLGERVIVVVDLRVLLALPPGEEVESGRERLVIIRADGMEAGLRCDRALGIDELPLEALRAPHLLSGEALHRVLAGELESKGRVVGVVNPARLLAAARVAAR